MFRLMIVEDEPLIASTLATRLTRYGYEVVAIVSSGEEALRKAPLMLPNMVLMDMTLGGEFDGVQAAAQLREKFNIPSIFLTSRSDFDTIERAKYSRPLGYILKPYQEEELYRTLKLALQTHQTEVSLRQSEQALAELNRSLESKVLERTAALQITMEKLEGSLKEKEILLKEVHHRVKNNLQIISSLLRMQSASIQHPAAAALLVESQSRIRSMALVHEALYKSENFNEVSFRVYLQTLVHDLLNSYGAPDRKVHVDLQVEDVVVDLDTSLPCGLIVTELMTNALKYAFPLNGEGQIRVAFQQREDHARTLIVEDNGVGLPPNLDWQNAPSLGFRIITALSKQLKGTVQLRSSSQGGVLFMLSLPGSPRHS